MKLPMLGTSEKTETSRYQVSLVERAEGVHPADYRRIHRFFDTIEDRNTFVTLFESSVQKSGGHLVQNPLTHALFVSFYVVDGGGNKQHEIVVYD